MKIIFLLSVFYSSSSWAHRLNEITPVITTCDSQDLLSEPMAEREFYQDPSWKKWLASDPAKTAFDVLTVDRNLRSAHIVKDGVTSEHIDNILADGIKKLKRLETNALQTGELRPILEGKTYTAEELQRRKDSTNAFYQAHVEQILVNSYMFYLSVMEQREKIRAEPKDPALLNLAEAMVEQHRQLLNAQIKKELPTVIEKLGEIPPTKDLNFPLSYRDGVVVGFHMEKVVDGKPLVISLYPRMILNQLLGEDDYFIRALTLWRDYTRSQYTELRDTFDSYSPELASVFAFADNPELRRRKLAADRADVDLANALRIHELMKSMTEPELLSMLDLFRQLEVGNIPLCGQTITELNSRMREQLAGAKNTNAPQFASSKKQEVDQFAKDVIFFQDMYDVYSQAAAYLTKKVSN